MEFKFHKTTREVAKEWYCFLNFQTEALGTRISRIFGFATSSGAQLNNLLFRYDSDVVECG